MSSAQQLQKAIANAINHADARTTRLETTTEDLERRIHDLELVVYELTGSGDDTRSDISYASTCKYAAPANAHKRLTT